VWTVLTCIRDDHDLRFVLVAALLCVIGVVTALQFHRRSITSSGAARLGWMCLTGAVAGSAVWATHFVAMLAYHTNLPIRYDMGPTAASLVVAIVGMGLGFAYSGLGKSLWRQVIGGIAIGVSVAAMHFVGIAAVRSSFDLQWNMGFVFSSIILSVLGATGALIAQRRLTGWWRRTVPVASLVLGIVLLHFTAMTALTVVPDLTLPAVAEVISRHVLAIITTAISLLVVGLALLLTMIEGRSRKSSLKSLEVAFQGVPSGLAMYGAEGRLVLWNSAYEALISSYGIKPWVGMTRTDLLTEVARSGLAPGVKEEGEKQWIARLDSERAASTQALEWVTPDGKWLRAESSPLANGGGISVLTDITSLKAATDAMADARDRAEAANLAKSDFLTNMSHEIRTPLNGVLGMAQVMENDDLSEPQRDRLKVIRESGAALLAILNDLLDLSKVQAGKLELEEAPADLVAVTRQVAAAFNGAASGRDLSLTVEIADGATGVWKADALRVRQILSNLVGNALKFTHQGGVTLGLSVEDGVVFTVRDTGIGIDADAAPRLFEKFSQADASTTRQYGGTGLGLNICRELAELMGGEIVVTSVKGEGSCFTVRLPLTQISAEAPQPTSERAGEAMVERRLRILAAEDNATNQLVLRSLLEPVDCELIMANNGREAVALFEREEVDLILMDIQMPVMNGVEATVAIRESEKISGRQRTPIVALSANVMNHQIAEYMAVGMDGWVAKPIELEKLYAALDAALSGEPQQAAA
jgi:signal transduction histidine kinase/NO-binding membrane sensor protein with MHYT domain/ActR/RegA family two-component response regulator